MSTHKIISKQFISDTAFVLKFERNDISFEPGACVSIKNRPYSIASSASDEYIMLLVRKIGEVSTYLSELSPDDEIVVQDTFNYFNPGKGMRDGEYVYIATGVGVAPFLSAFKSYQHKPYMTAYGIRESKDLIEDLLISSMSHRLVVAVSREDGYAAKRVTDASVLNQIPLKDNFTYYLCGVDGMIDQVSDHLIHNGVEVTNVKSELFFMQ